jgi:hypothetical protein
MSRRNPVVYGRMLRGRKTSFIMEQMLCKRSATRPVIYIRLCPGRMDGETGGDIICCGLSARTVTAVNTYSDCCQHVQ